MNTGWKEIDFYFVREVKKLWTVLESIVTLKFIFVVVILFWNYDFFDWKKKSESDYLQKSWTMNERILLKVLMWSSKRWRNNFFKWYYNLMRNIGDFFWWWKNKIFYENFFLDFSRRGEIKNFSRLWKNLIFFPFWKIFKKCGLA